MPGEKKTYKTFPKIHYLSCAFLNRLSLTKSKKKRKKQNNKKKYICN